MANYQQISIEKLMDRLQERTQAPAGSFWSSQEYFNAVVEALRLWQAATGAITQVFSISTDALDGAWMTIPSSTVGVSRVVYRNPADTGRSEVGGTPLVPDTLGALDYCNGTWEADSGTPERWVPDGVTRIGLFPVPPPAARLQIEGPVDIGLLGEGDFVNLGQEEISVILAVGEHYLAFKQGGAEIGATSDALKRLVAGAALRNQHLRKSKFYRRFMGLGSEPLADVHKTTEGKKNVGARQ